MCKTKRGDASRSGRPDPIEKVDVYQLPENGETKREESNCVQWQVELNFLRSKLAEQYQLSTEMLRYQLQHFRYDQLTSSYRQRQYFEQIAWQKQQQAQLIAIRMQMQDQQADMREEEKMAIDLETRIDDRLRTPAPSYSPPPIYDPEPQMSPLRFSNNYVPPTWSSERPSRMDAGREVASSDGSEILPTLEISPLNSFSHATKRDLAKAASADARPTKTKKRAK